LGRDKKPFSPIEFHLSAKCSTGISGIQAGAKINTLPQHDREMIVQEWGKKPIRLTQHIWRRKRAIGMR
jgi:hypothetical protein